MFQMYEVTSVCDYDTCNVALHYTGALLKLSNITSGDA